MDSNIFLYNAQDAIYTRDVDNELRFLMDDDYQRMHDFTVSLYQPLMFMMTRGVLVDTDKLAQVKKQVWEQYEQKQAELNEIAGRELNANSPKQLKNYFYVEKGIDPYTKRNAKGKSSITLDDKALQRIARGTSKRQGLPEAKLVQEIRALLKLHGTYLDLDLDTDKRFRCSYNPRGTRFGRLSSSKTIFNTGMNMQNLPSVFKKFLVPDPGYFMWEIDKAKAEWVVVAYCAGESNMIRVIEEGLDPHIHTAHLMTELPKELIEEEGKLVGHSTDPEEIKEIRRKISQASIAAKHAFDRTAFLPRNMSVRQCGKKSNHGLNYDEGYRTFALTNEMLETDAMKIIELYKHKAYPGIPIWHKSIQNKLKEDRMLENCFGRKNKFLDAWGPDLFKAAYSFIPQSTVADLVNHGIVDTYEDQTYHMQVQELLGQVHDSVLGQYPLSDNLFNAASALKDTAAYMNREMEYSGRTFHIDNDLKVSKVSWGDMEEVDINVPTLELQKSLEALLNE